MTQPRRTNPLSPLVQAAPALPAAALFIIGPGAGLAARSGVQVVLLALAAALWAWLLRQPPGGPADSTASSGPL